MDMCAGSAASAMVGYNRLASCSVAMVSDAPHPEAARAWLDFIRSDAAFKVFEHCGFQRYEAKPQPCNATW
jgi:ABC-type Fe3+ transport system substrate-binding protein